MRKAQEGEVAADVYGFLSTKPNATAAAVNPKAMPVIMTSAGEIDAWPDAPSEKANPLHQSLADER